MDIASQRERTMVIERAKITESTIKRKRATALESIKSDERDERVESTIYAERARPLEGTT